MPVKANYKNVVSWTDDLDDKTREQAERTAAMPFIDGHLALMPDCHYGYGSTIGSVVPTKGAIMPSCVGVDIGCGMIAVETTLTSADLPDNLDALHALWVKAIPAGMGKGHEYGHDLDAAIFAHYPGTPDAFTARQAEKATKQFGSLGGGNHFAELCLDERDVVWVVLHSGSRGTGKELAEVHIDRAKGLMEEWFITLADPDLAYLPERSAEFDAYITDMRWAQEYALGSREAMMDAALREVARFLDADPRGIEADRINCHHNFTEMENHRGRNIWITRKGAIRARSGDRGIIPGSMGAASFIVSGKGNPASYNSCSHGAGRRLGRKQAERVLTLDDFTASMDGISWDASKADQLIDEAPAAYKDIDVVMANQADLVTIEHRLHQVLNMKGTK